MSGNNSKAAIDAAVKEVRDHINSFFGADFSMAIGMYTMLISMIAAQAPSEATMLAYELADKLDTAAMTIRKAVENSQVN